VSKKFPSRADVNNPNNDAYWQARGLPQRPRDWKVHVERDRCEPSSRTRGPFDGRGLVVDSMFDPLCKDDY